MPNTPAPAITHQAIAAALATRTLGRSLLVLQETTSTNAAALEAAQSGTPDGAVVVADRQTAGRGRLARTWESPPGCNLYVSVVVRRLPGGDRLGWLPLISATAAAAAIDRLSGARPSLKWPNDLMLGGKKLGGVLCESAGIGTEAACVVIGIGLNVNWPEAEMPAEIRSLATSLLAQAPEPVDRVSLLAEILLELESRIDRWRNGDVSLLAEEYRRLCGTIGQSVRVELAGQQSVEGLAVAIEPNGSLRVRVKEGSTVRDCLVSSGDVVHLRPQPSATSRT
jgi:BirA family biotin operon repressor/biotin-[acetyl-CoA-carboxylase] ligase